MLTALWVQLPQTSSTCLWLEAVQIAQVSFWRCTGQRNLQLACSCKRLHPRVDCIMMWVVTEKWFWHRALSVLRQSSGFHSMVIYFFVSTRRVGSWKQPWSLHVNQSGVLFASDVYRQEPCNASNKAAILFSLLTPPMHYQVWCGPIFGPACTSSNGLLSYKSWDINCHVLVKVLMDAKKEPSNSMSCHSARLPSHETKLHKGEKCSIVSQRKWSQFWGLYFIGID